jgi:hypothetical protein
MSTAADALNEDELDREITHRTKAAYDSVREKLNRTAELYTEATERMKKKLERPTAKKGSR